MALKASGRSRPSGFSLSLLILLISCGSTAAAISKPYFRSTSFNYSEPVSISAAIDGWITPAFKKGDQQLSFSHLELGVALNNWRFGFIKRLEYFLNFSPDTADYYYRAQNDVPLDVGKEYQLHINASQFEASGLRVARGWNFQSGFNLELGISYLEAANLFVGELSGSQYTTDLKYFYSEDRILNRPVEDPDGRGMSMDMSLLWQVSNRVTLETSITDVYGWLDWKRTPYTLLDADADQTMEDENGFVTFKPLAQGYEGTINSFRQSLKSRSFSTLTARVNPQYAATLSHRFQNEEHTLAFGGRWPYRSVEFDARYWPETSLAELGMAANQWRLSLGVDSFERDKVQTFWLSLSFQ